MVEIIDIAEGAGNEIAGKPIVAALESGAVLRLARPSFVLSEEERGLVARGMGAGMAKNVSYSQESVTLKGTPAQGAERALLAGMLARYADYGVALLREIAPSYISGLKMGRTSFRPVEIADRETSWRKDDRRLHVDAFPSTPTGGARILRLFLNIDQAGRPRCWRVGPDFEAYATRFLPHVPRAWPGAASLLAALHITKTRRTRYDQIMLGLHDAAKADMGWQANAPARAVDFLPGQAWMAFTDQVPHAAMSGCNALEQSFYVSPDVLACPASSPLAVLSRLTGRDLTRPLF